MLFLHLAAPSIDPLLTTNPLAVDDRADGTLILVNPGNTVVITVVANSNPCATVEWSFAGSLLSSDQQYTVSDPCGAKGSSNTFTLTIHTLTAVNSGRYSAIFSNPGGNTPLPRLVVTVPGNQRL